ncbi:MAG: cytochrome c biogenesis CcdA family protein [Minisyncoccia bacterium]
MDRKIILFIVLIILILCLFYSFLNNYHPNNKILFPIITIAALIDSINPCAISVLILTITFLFSLSSLRIKIFQIGFSYIIGIFIAYLLIGLSILSVFVIFQTPHFMSKIGAIIISVFGVLEVLEALIKSFPIKLKIPDKTHNKIAILIQKASIIPGFILGILVGVSGFPCVGGPYLMILGLLHDKSTLLIGLLYLIYYNFIFVLPLIIILLIASDRNVLTMIDTWRKNHTKLFRFIIGIIMIIFGIIMYLV